MITTKDSRIREGKNTVGEFEISYSAQQQTATQAGVVSASVEKAGEHFGNINAYSTGTLYINFSKENSSTRAELKELVVTILDDITSILE